MNFIILVEKKMIAVQLTVKLYSCTHDYFILDPFSFLTGEKPKAEEQWRDPLMDDRFEFDPEECSVVNGKWVFNRSIKPLYTDESCPYLDRQVSCVKNGREDSDYRHWEWQPDECRLPRFEFVFGDELK